MSRFQLFGAIAGALLFPAPDPSPRPVPQAASTVPLVVDAAWLAQRLGQPGLVVLHVGDRKSFESEHIPGAQLIGFDDISAPQAEGALALELPPADVLRERLERFGISDDSRIVVYFAGNWVSPATRVILTLDHLGLGAQTALLDGGLPQWKREGRAVTAAAATPPARGTLSKRATKAVTVDAAAVQANAKRSGYKVIDARAPVFYAGRGNSHDRPGHVPGAVNVPYTSVFTDSLRLTSRDSLARIFTNAGVQKGDTILAYCHIGQQATAVVFAARLLGHPVKLYDGSFQDWSRRTELPVENPAAGQGSR